MLFELEVLSVGASSGSIFDLFHEFVHLAPTGDATRMRANGAMWQRLKEKPLQGHLMGAARMTRNIGWEKHSGDEFVFLLSGETEIAMDEDGAERRVSLSPRQAFLVPRGVWHRLVITEPCEVLFVTPEPSEGRPLSGT